MRVVRSTEEINRDIKRGAKVCKRCNGLKSFEFYSKDKRIQDGRMGYCKACMKEIKAEQKAARSTEENVRLNRKYNLKKCYGIELEDYDRMFKEQDGKCKICGSRDSKSDRSEHLFVDHDHTTGVVRSLLCHNCNIIIGKADENRDVLLAAVDYIDNILEERT